MSLVGLFLLVSIGCNNPDARYIQVEGTITYQGQLVEGASVTFLPVDAEGEPASGITDTNGRFVMTSAQATRGGQGVLPGEYHIVVTKRGPTPLTPDEQAYADGRIDSDEFERRRNARGSDAPAPPRAPELLPAQYGAPGTTPLRATVDRGNRAFDFTLAD